MKFRKLFLIAIILISVTPQTAGAANLPLEKIRWFWSDSNSSDLQRTFSEGEFANAGDVPYIRVEANDPSFQLKSIYLESYQSGRWKQYGISNPLSPDYDNNNFDLMQGILLVDPECGIYTWCKGIVKFRLVIENNVLSNFSVNFIPKQSQLSVRLSSPAEVAWGSLFNLSVSVNPKATSKCTLVRGSEQISKATFTGGKGKFSVRALAYQKPAGGITQVNFLVTCQQGQKDGKAEKTITVYVP